MSNLTVHQSIEAPRGCGYRKPSKGGVGIYLVGPSETVACDRLPFILEACPCCSGGVKPSRSWAWIEPRSLLGVPSEAEYQASDHWEIKCSLAHCRACPMGLGAPEGRHGLIWVGEGFYPTPQDFMSEAGRMGVSRKLPALPKGFELGKTVVYLAHHEGRRQCSSRVTRSRSLGSSPRSFVGRRGRSLTPRTHARMGICGCSSTILLPLTQRCKGWRWSTQRTWSPSSGETAGLAPSCTLPPLGLRSSEPLSKRA